MSTSLFPRYFLTFILCVLCSSALATHTKHHEKKKHTPTQTNLSHKEEFVNFNEWEDIKKFIDALSKEEHFDKEKLITIFNHTRYIESAIQQIKPAPPTKAKDWQAYQARFIEPLRIQTGLAFWKANERTLQRAEEQYGIPAYILVGLIGVETIYGKNTGRFRVMDVLTTLAFHYPDTPNKIKRMEFFKNELKEFLRYTQQFNLDPLSIRGSYAGAIGLPQFMPSSIRNYAIDFNNDGKIDLQNSPEDAIGSVAHYLFQHGWKRDQPLAYPVEITQSKEQTLWQNYLNQELKAKYTLEEFQTAGIQTPTSMPTNMLWGLIDLQNGALDTEYWLGSDNFFAITLYNRSFFYAMSVIKLGEEINKLRNK